MSTPEAPTVRTTHGALRGSVVSTSHGDVTRYAGVPYAAAPIGDARFRAPAAALPWQGVRPALDFGPDPMQAVSGPFAAAVPGTTIGAVAEDCLTLNVWTPAVDAEARLAVMVWVAGGAFVVGGTSQATYDGARFAAEQHVVVVTVNYRVGCFGFLDLRSVAGGDSADTNCGLRDLVAALQWIGDNAVGFGGDPSRITVFGESAGAGLITHLLTTPNVGSLITGAIAQSPGVDFTQRAELSAVVTAALLDRTAATTVADLRALSAAQLLEAQQHVAGALLFDVGTMPFHPVVDGVFITESPSIALTSGAARDVALLIGFTSDEMRLFTDPRPSRMTRDSLSGWVRTSLTSRAGHDPGAATADALLDHYLAAAPAGRSTGTDVWAAIQTDGIMRLPVLRVADGRDPAGAPTFVYEFAWQSRIGDDGTDRGAFHAIDLPFVFDTFDAGWTDFIGADNRARRLGTALRTAWSAFAATGDPSSEPVGDWPRYDTAERATMVLDALPHVVADPLRERRSWWSGLWSPSCRPPTVPR